MVPPLALPVRDGRRSYDRSVPASSDPGRSRPFGFGAVAGGAIASVVAYRVGLVDGGLVGLQVLVGLVGWWLGSAPPGLAGLRQRGSEAWSRLWVPVLVTVAGAVVWVGITPTMRHDVVLRGEALGLFGVHGNWQQLARGPVEGAPGDLVTPLQHVWFTSVVVQLVLVWAVIAAWSTWGRRGRARPVAAPCAVLALVAVAWTVLALALGAGEQTLVLATPAYGAAFAFGALLGAEDQRTLGRTVREFAARTWSLALGLLVLVALVGRPGSTLAVLLGAVVVPLATTIVLAAAAPQRGPHPPPVIGGRVDLWATLVAVWLLHGPTLALTDPARTGWPTALAVTAGIVLTVLLALAVGVGRQHRSDEPARVELRRVLAPPAAVALLVALGSITGAFHWFSPRPEARSTVEQGR